MFRIIFSALSVFLATTAYGEIQPLPMTYEIFEASVAHLDLETCPEGLPQSGSFCRAAVLYDMILVFAFAEDGDSVLTGYAAFEAPDLSANLE